MNLSNVSNSLRLREYYYMATRHKGLFAIVTVLCILVSVIVAVSLPKIYQAETVLLIQDKDILNPLISGLAISPSVYSRIHTLREELLSWQRLTLLVEKLKLDQHIKTPLEYERLIKNLRNSLSIRFRGSDIIAVSHEGRDPKKSQEIVQTLSDIIVDGSLTSQKIEANTAIRFIQEQLNTYRGKLEKSEEELRKYREVYSSTLPVATRMNEQLVALKIELQHLLVENTEEHPRVIQTRQLIESMEAQRDEWMQKSKEAGIDINKEEYSKLVSSVPLQEQQLARLSRDYQVNERIYEALLQRLETAKISETLEQSDQGPKFRILEPARLPLTPVKPRKPLIVLGGFIVGFILSGLLIYLLELSDASIRSLDEARLMLDLPIFGSIPPIRPEELMIEKSLVGGGRV